MMIWRNLSPRTLASVLDLVLDRRGRTQAPGRSQVVDQDGIRTAPSILDQADNRTTTADSALR